jgi:hypothetical protein
VSLFLQKKLFVCDKFGLPLFTRVQERGGCGTSWSGQGTLACAVSRTEPIGPISFYSEREEGKLVDGGIVT